MRQSKLWTHGKNTFEMSVLIHKGNWSSNRDDGYHPFTADTREEHGKYPAWRE